MYSQKEMDRCIQHARSNPIQSRGRTSISRMAALITDGSGITQLGLNRYKSHPLMKKFSQNDNKISLHAEIDALWRCLQYFHKSNDFGITNFTLENFDIYIARVLKDGTPALAKPCSTCMGALMYFGIRNIYWTGQ